MERRLQRSGVFVLQADDVLVAMQPSQFAQETDFQGLVSRFPELLVGDQIDAENPRRFALVKQEQSIDHDTDAARWSIDHLFVDQDGVPTLVEVKRKTDTRLRREVVGQMLDYAANCQFSGQGLRTVVPMVFGQTQEAAAKRASAPSARWTEERYLEKIDEKFSEQEAAVARSVLNWMKGSGLPLVWGTGRENGSVYPLLRLQGVTINPAYISTEGKIWLQLGLLKGRPVFNDAEVRRELLGRFGMVIGSNFKEQDIERSPSLSFATIAADPEGAEKVVRAFAWIVERVKLAA